MPSREELFRLHSENLHNVCATNKDLFVCPICFSAFPFDAIARNEIDIGHVFPQYLRNKCSVTEQYQILLCKRCNSTSGSRGEKAVEELEKFLEGHPLSPYQSEMHIPYKPQIMFFSDPPWGKQVRLRADVSMRNGSVFIQWGKTLKKAKRRNNPKDLETFFKIPRKDLFIVPSLIKKHEIYLAQHGWLTIAYLFAFYLFGYKLIFQSYLDPIRDQIKQSFDLNFSSSTDFKPLLYVQSVEEIIDEPQMDAVLVYRCRSHYLELRFLHVRVQIPLFSVGSVTTPEIKGANEIGRRIHLDTNHLHNIDGYWKEFLGETDYWKSDF